MPQAKYKQMLHMVKYYKLNREFCRNDQSNSETDMFTEIYLADVILVKIKRLCHAYAYFVRVPFRVLIRSC